MTVLVTANEGPSFLYSLDFEKDDDFHPMLVCLRESVLRTRFPSKCEKSLLDPRPDPERNEHPMAQMDQ